MKYQHLASIGFRNISPKVLEDDSLKEIYVYKQCVYSEELFY